MIMTILRSILAVVVGIIVMFIVIMGMQFISIAMHPMPDGVRMDDKLAITAWMATLPTSALAIVLTAYVVGSFAGGGVSALIAACCRIIHAGIIGALVVLAAIMNFRQYPGVHPDWMVMATYALPVPVSLFAGWLVATTRPAPKLERS